MEQLRKSNDQFKVGQVTTLEKKKTNMAPKSVKPAALNVQKS